MTKRLLFLKERIKEIYLNNKKRLSSDRKWTRFNYDNNEYLFNYNNKIEDDGN